MFQLTERKLAVGVVPASDILTLKKDQMLLKDAHR
jgi:hypothetical protein